MISNSKSGFVSDDYERDGSLQAVVCDTIAVCLPTLLQGKATIPVFARCAAVYTENC